VQRADELGRARSALQAVEKLDDCEHARRGRKRLPPPVLRARGSAGAARRDNRPSRRARGLPARAACRLLSAAARTGPRLRRGARSGPAPRMTPRRVPAAAQPPPRRAGRRRPARTPSRRPTSASRRMCRGPGRRRHDGHEKSSRGEPRPRRAASSEEPSRASSPAAATSMPAKRSATPSSPASTRCCEVPRDSGAAEDGSAAREPDAAGGARCPQRDSNPRYSLERAVTWAASRWGPAAQCRGELVQLPFGA
jgi:hypothetical protein